MIHRYDVIIAGGGMVGLSLACALGKAGKKVAILEVGEIPPAFSASDEYAQRVVALNRASQVFLTHLGAWEKLHSWRVSRYEKMEVRDASGNGKVRFSAADLNEPDLGHIVENRLIQRALYECLNELDSVDWLNPVSMKNFVADEQDLIVTLGDGKVLTAQLLVGADGRFSKVREAAGILLKENDYQQLGIVAIVESELHHDFTARQRFLADGVLAFLPMQDGRCSIVWSAHRERAEELMGMDDESFATNLVEASEQRLGKVIRLGPRAAFPLIGTHTECYVKPRLALVGDAAHTIHPLAGQGVNLGFMDAAELAEVLTHASRDLGSLSVLRRYERARAGENLAMQKLMEGFQLLFINDNPPLVRLRNLGLGITQQLAPVKNEMMRYALGMRGGLPELARSGWR
jgi:2-octaprenylphenol hydroxylase